MDVNRYIPFYSLLYSLEPKGFQQILDAGFQIGNDMEDVDAFEETLWIHEFNEDTERPVESFEFKVAELFLKHGFDLRMHRRLLNGVLSQEIQRFMDDEYLPYRKPDCRPSAFLIRHHVHVNALSDLSSMQEVGRTPLDIAYRWECQENGVNLRRSLRHTC